MDNTATRTIICPLCLNYLTLEDFEIVNHEDETWSTGDVIECTHSPCVARFTVTRSRARFQLRDLPVATPKKR